MHLANGEDMAGVEPLLSALRKQLRRLIAAAAYIAPEIHMCGGCCNQADLHWLIHFGSPDPACAGLVGELLTAPQHLRHQIKETVDHLWLKQSLQLNTLHHDCSQKILSHLRHNVNRSGKPVKAAGSAKA
ncbi:hypothetical protein ABBQ38_004451 [Trebouxia sp. C0009 RCD-2024]